MACVPTDEGWLYVALVLDRYARKLVGWAMSETMPRELTLAALDIALGWRDPGAGLPRHSDRGSQYAAKSCRKKLKARGITVSMRRKGDCWDNAQMESVNSTLKVECVNNVHFQTRAEARQANVEYVGCYNTERWHSSLGDISPAEYARRWRDGIDTEEKHLATVRPCVTHRRPAPVRRRRPSQPSVDNAYRASRRPLNGDRFTGPFREVQVGRDQHARVFVQPGSADRTVLRRRPG